MTVTEAEYDDGSLRLSVRFDPNKTLPLDELLTDSYVKLSVYDREEFAERGMLALYNRIHC
ncbi:hypothetical protein [Haladaptatus halobius]|uniref:hypothetical protein n=1 Tax=Haladaptatus halobius TaxID=2884875 RepID=UPI001D0BC6F6|nr:hypothetical protein [Haladaptatus halobius]